MASLTLRYTFKQPRVEDISTTFFAITNIPHVRCFYAEKYIVVTLADDKDYTQHSTLEMTKKLADKGYDLVESLAMRAKRTVMAFRVHESLRNNPTMNTQAHSEQTAASVPLPTLSQKLTSTQTRAQ